MKKFEEIFRYKTATELKKEYPDYWVLLINAKYSNDNELIGGYFVAKGKNHNKVWEKSKKVDCKGVTFSNYFLGTIKVPEYFVLCQLKPNSKFLSINKHNNKKQKAHIFVA